MTKDKAKNIREALILPMGKAASFERLAILAQTEVFLDIAVSLERIAIALDQPATEYGECGVEAIAGTIRRLADG